MGFKQLFSRSSRQTQTEPAAGGQAHTPGLPEGSLVLFPRRQNQAVFEENLIGLAGLFFESETGEGNPQIVVLSGAEGSGKTQLAVEFAYRYAQHFDGIHWIDAGSRSCLAAEIAQYSPVMKLPFESENMLEQAEAVLQTWRNSQRLLILDQLDQAERWTEWLPKLASTRVLVTSEQEQWRENPIVRQVRLTPLDSSESEALLQSMAPRIRKASDASFKELVKSLGPLPLALRLAACYLEENGRVSVNAYLARHTAARTSLLPSIKTWIGKNTQPGLEEFITAAELNLRQIQSSDRVETLAQQIFWLCACCTPGLPVPVFLLKNDTRFSDDTSAIYDKALERLYRLGLLTATAEGPVIHPLLAQFARLRENRNTAGLARLAEAILSAESGLIKKKRFRSLLILRAHIEAVAALAEEAGLKQASKLWDLAGNRLWILGEPERARYALERAIAIDENQPVIDENQLAAKLSSLGQVRAELGDQQGAKASLEQAIALVEKNPTLKYSILATYTRQLGQVLLDMGDVAGGKACLERAIISHEASYGYGPKHREVGIDADFLGRFYEKHGDFHAAKGYYERVLTINENIFVYGPEHHKVARNASNLGRVLRELGNLPGAKACFERALEINEKVYGPVHVEVKRNLAGLAATHQELQDFKEAQACLERVLEIDEKMYSAPNTEIAGDLYRLGLVLRAQSNLTEAKACFQRALEIEEKLRGAEHPNISVNLYNLGRILHEQRDLQGARACYERTLAIDKKLYGMDHPYTATDINNLGGILQDLQDLPGAMACFQQALTIDEKISGAEHPNVARDLNNLGSVYKDMGKMPEAYGCFERALEIFKFCAGPDHPNTRVVYDNLTSVHRKMQQSANRSPLDGNGK